jgi:hypothetical protein
VGCDEEAKEGKEMKFQVARTSTHGVRTSAEKPCDGAVAEERTLYWKRKGGLESRVETLWFIEIRTIKQLVELMRREGEDLVIREPLVLSEKDELGEPLIEIYDDYRE